MLIVLLYLCGDVWEDGGVLGVGVLKIKVEFIVQGRRGK